MIMKLFVSLFYTKIDLQKKFKINLMMFSYVPNLYVINKAYKLGI